MLVAFATVMLEGHLHVDGEPLLGHQSMAVPLAKFNGQPDVSVFTPEANIAPFQNQCVPSSGDNNCSPEVVTPPMAILQTNRWLWFNLGRKLIRYNLNVLGGRAGI
jgi:hypothetical protein